MTKVLSRLNRAVTNQPGNHLINEPKVVTAVFVEWAVDYTTDETDDDT